MGSAFQGWKVAGYQVIRSEFQTRSRFKMPKIKQAQKELRSRRCRLLEEDTECALDVNILFLCLQIQPRITRIGISSTGARHDRLMRTDRCRFEGKQRLRGDRTC